MSIVEESLLVQIARLELALGRGRFSILPIQHIRNTTSFVPQYAGLQPLFTQQHNAVPAQAGPVDLSMTMSNLRQIQEADR